MNDINLPTFEQLKAANEKAKETLSTLCKNPGSFTMRIPANEDKDTDLILAKALGHESDLLTLIANEKQYKWIIAAAQLSHLMADCNGDWVPIYDGFNEHICIVANHKQAVTTRSIYKHFLTFPDTEQGIRTAGAFLNKHRELINQFYMVGGENE